MRKMREREEKDFFSTVVFFGFHFISRINAHQEAIMVARSALKRKKRGEIPTQDSLMLSTESSENVSRPEPSPHSADSTIPFSLSETALPEQQSKTIFSHNEEPPIACSTPLPPPKPIASSSPSHSSSSCDKALPISPSVFITSLDQSASSTSKSMETFELSEGPAPRFYPMFQTKTTGIFYATLSNVYVSI